MTFAGEDAQSMDKDSDMYNYSVVFPGDLELLALSRGSETNTPAINIKR